MGERDIGKGIHKDSGKESSPAPATGRAVTWLMAAGVVAAAATLILATEQIDPPLARGTTAPAIDLPLVGGEGRITLRELQGNVVLVNFWATWCKPCEEEMPAMERLYRAVRDDGFELLAVSVDKDPALVQTFRERIGLTFPIALDPDEAVSRAYQTLGYPESILVDRDGRVLERYVGPRDWDSRAYVKRIQDLLRDAS